jgi:hypothetical protein
MSIAVVLFGSIVSLIVFADVIGVDGASALAEGARVGWFFLSSHPEIAIAAASSEAVQTLIRSSS